MLLFCQSRKYPYPSHKTFVFGLNSPPPPIWKFQVCFVYSFRNTGFLTPPPPPPFPMTLLDMDMDISELYKLLLTYCTTLICVLIYS